MAKRVSEFCLEELLGEIADEIGPRLTAAGLEPVYDLHPAIPAWLHGNGQELRRALMRQCDQAIAHRWRGELIIDLRPVSAAPRQLVIACLVRPWWPDTDGVPAATAGDSMHWRARESSHPDAAAAPDPQRVLLVDHRPGTRQVNSRYLRRLRCTVFQAEDANEAVQLLAAMSRAPDTLIINLALEDAPDANPALRVLRCWTGPLALVLDDREARVRCPDPGTGTVQRLPAPILPRRLAAALACAPAKRAAAGAGTTHPRTAPTTLEPGPARSSDVELDRAGALLRVGGNLALYESLLGRFCTEEPATVVAVRQALERGDNAGAGSLTHGLKGLAANLGINAVAAAAGELERVLRHGPAPDVALEHLGAAMARIIARVQAAPVEPAAQAAVGARNVEASLAQLHAHLVDDDAAAIDDLGHLEEALGNDWRQALLKPVARLVRQYDFPGAHACLEQCYHRLAGTAPTDGEAS